MRLMSATAGDAHPAVLGAAGGVACRGETSRAMTIVVKYGGNAMAAADADDWLLDEIAERTIAGDRLVVVHGGGPQIDAELAAHGIASRRVDGQRVTDAATLAVTERVLCGEVNKALVRALLRRGANAVGVSGQDGACVRAALAHARDGSSLGFVGEISRVDPALLQALLARGFVPVVAPLAVSQDLAQALNVNADTTAGAIAGAISADAYVVVTDVAYVLRDLRDPTSAIVRMTASEARALLAGDVFDGGMRPKMESALAALAAGASAVTIGGRGRGGIAAALAGNATTLVPD